jgi:hypothetical protein
VPVCVRADMVDTIWWCPWCDAPLFIAVTDGMLKDVLNLLAGLIKCELVDSGKADAACVVVQSIPI